MKKTLLLAASLLLCCVAGHSQTVNVHKTDGTTLTLPAAEVDYIDFTASDSQGGDTGQAPENAKAIDLGLPSGTKWANMNVGATSPQENGLYFAWGETVGYTDDTTDGRSFDWASYKWCNGSSDSLTKYCTSSAAGTVDNKTVLDPEDDAAHVNWGGDWRMPTYEEFQELLSNTTSEWVTVGDVTGRKFTSKTNGNSVFLPAAGYRYGSGLYYQSARDFYWSSSVYPSSSDYARVLLFHSGNAGTGYGYRYVGQSVRPVLKN